jgi:hypothetical protein
MAFPYAQSRALLLDYLKTHQSGQYQNVVLGVIELAQQKQLLGESPTQSERTDAYELVRQHLWALLAQGVIVFGVDHRNPNWPWYRLTGHGEAVVDGTGAQPYDPTGFMAEFRSANPRADAVIVDYLDEALRAFVHNCPKSAAVMVGAASEKAVLLLHEAFGAAITDATQRTKFEKESQANWTISHKYGVLKDRLDKMVAAKKFASNRELRDSIDVDIPGLFNQARRQRNTAGHPEIVANVSPDSVFLTLRVMTEYIRQVQALIDYFVANPAEW